METHREALLRSLSTHRGLCKRNESARALWILLSHKNHASIEQFAFAILGPQSTAQRKRLIEMENTCSIRGLQISAESGGPLHLLLLLHRRHSEVDPDPLLLISLFFVLCSVAKISPQQPLKAAMRSMAVASGGAVPVGDK